jgi:hypothetical protein
VDRIGIDPIHTVGLGCGRSYGGIGAEWQGTGLKTKKESDDPGNRRDDTDAAAPQQDEPGKLAENPMGRHRQ